MFILSYLVQGSCNCDAFNLVNLEMAKITKKTFTRFTHSFIYFTFH